MSSEHRYTGHVKDSETQMEYAGARYYANGKGRWGAADPYLGEKDDPQQQNRYAYVVGDPVSFSDPDGYHHESTTTIWL